MKRAFKRDNSLNEKVFEGLKIKVVKKSKGKYENSFIYEK